MNIDDQVISIEYAKKLKELGVKQHSIFVWEYHNEQYYRVQYIPYAVVPNTFNEPEWYSAFSASELMELIPPIIDTKNNEPFNNFRFDLQRSVVVKDNEIIPVFLVNYHCDTFQVESGSPFFALKLIMHNIYDAKLEDCLAKLLIWLIENGYVNYGQPDITK